MNFRLKNLLPLFFVLPAACFAQDRAPLISGTARFSVEQGTVECDIVLSEYTHIDDYVIRLNSGLNILNIQSLEPNDFMMAYDRSFAEDEQTDETNSYYFRAGDGRSKFLPSKLRFRYTGKFPVVRDTLGDEYTKVDWRGNVSFNDHILRADGLQAALFPVLYDVKKEYAYAEVRYDLEIECEDCETIYMNGSAPQKTKKARFKSDIPREPYLFMGNYNVQETRSMQLLNTRFSPSELEEFERMNNEIGDFLRNYTKQELREKITWVQGNTTARLTGFSFVSYPTFTTVGYPPYDLQSSFKESYSGIFAQVMAHELSHYYFGVMKKHNNVLENLFNEGFAEFLSLKYLQGTGQAGLAGVLINSKKEYINDKEFVLRPMGKFKDLTHTNSRQTYGYDYQPLVLLAIEKEIGADRMQKWVELLLREETAISDFSFFTRTLSEAIGDEKLYNHVLNTYLLSERSVKNINKALK
ncbi:MAG: hypothetical protein ACT6QS_08710 [Flavobacteriales bacterium]